jgi:outer membrane receptor protein involved in Fe transport
MLGGEWREERLSTTVVPASPHRTISAAFAEIHAPLIGADMSIPAVRQLAVSIGARNDHYSDFGSRNSLQYGLVWQPSAELKLRASYSESYRPPLLFELYAPHFPAQLSLPDPKRRNTVSTFLATHGGNSELIPTAGHTWTTGIEFTPRDLPRLHMSIGYWRTTLAQQILALDLLSLLAHEDLFPSRVVRADPSPEDIEAGIPGALQTLDASWGNFGRLTAAGADLNVSFTWDTNIGRFTSNLSAVWNDEFNTVLVKGALPKNRVGIGSPEGTIPRWRAIASTTWIHGSFRAFLAAQFVSAYDDAEPFYGTPTGRTIPATVVFDAQASLHIGELVHSPSFLGSVELAAGVKNAFDERPHFAEAGHQFGYDYTQADLRQRFWYLRLAKRF